MFEDARYEYDQKQKELKEQALNGAKPGQPVRRQQRIRRSDGARDPADWKFGGGTPDQQAKEALARRQEMAGLNALRRRRRASEEASGTAERHAGEHGHGGRWSRGHELAERTGTRRRDRSCSRMERWRRSRWS